MFEGSSIYITPSLKSTFNEYFPLACFHPDTLLKLKDNSLVKKLKIAVFTRAR